MEGKKLKKLLTEVCRLQDQAGNLKPQKIVAFSKKCGWKLNPRGKHPTYENELWLDCPVLSVPDHSWGINKYTAIAILQQIEGVLIIQLEIAEEKEREANEKTIKKG